MGCELQLLEFADWKQREPSAGELKVNAWHCSTKGEKLETTQPSFIGNLGTYNKAWETYSSCVEWQNITLRANNIMA